MESTTPVQVDASTRYRSYRRDKVYLEGTTVEEVEQYHRDTLKLAIEHANKIIAEYEIEKRASAERERKQAEEHEQSVREAAKRIRFD